MFKYTSTFTGITTRTLSGSWKAYPSITMCVTAFNRFFEIPRGCTEAVLVFSKTRHPEAYYMQLGYDNAMSTQANVLLVDGYTVPLYGMARRTFKRLWNEGYNYVRLEVPA